MSLRTLHERQRLERLAMAAAERQQLAAQAAEQRAVMQERQQDKLQLPPHKGQSAGRADVARCGYPVP